MSDTMAVLWKEWRELLEQFASFKRGALAIVSMTLMFGIVLPWMMGPAWFTMAIMLAYWPFAAASMVINVVADAFAGERERHTLETLLASPLGDGGILLGKYLAALSFGVGSVLVYLTVGALTVNLVHGHGTLLLWSASRLLEILLLTVLGGALVAGLGVFVSLRAATARQAHQTFGIVIVVMFALPWVIVSMLPSARVDALAEWAQHADVHAIVWRAALVLLVADALALAAAKRRFRRRKLALD